MQQGGLRHKEYRKDVGPERALELVGGDLLDSFLRMLLGGIINENIETAKLSHHTVDCVLAKSFLSNVPRDGHTSASFLFDQSFRLLRVFVFVQIDDGHVGALSGECDGDGTADSTVAPRNHRHSFP